MKRILSILLSFALCLTLLPAAVQVHAASVNDLRYKIIDGQVTITGCAWYASGSLTIPATINGYPVTSIGDKAFYDCSSLTSVTIPDSVTSIGDSAFSFCTSLTGIIVSKNNPFYSNDSCGVLYTKDKAALLQAPCAISGTYMIPDSVTSIGSYAFADCYRLTSVTIPDSVTSIGFLAFHHCDSLQYNVYGTGKYLGNDENPYVVLTDTISTAITAIDIHSDTKIVGGGALSYCDSLTSVTIPDNVTSIGKRAFSDCTSLTSVTIPDSVTSIGDSAFSSCTSLTSVTIPDSVTSIGDSAFSSCTSLTSVTIPDSVTSIGGSAFEGCTSLTSVTIPDSVTSIESGAFYECTSLTSVYFAGNAPSVVNGSFFGVHATAYYHAGTSGWADAAPGNWTLGWWWETNGRITLREVDHIWSSYTYDNNHTCTVDGTERAVCLTCGETDIRRVEGTADHRVVYTSNNDATCTQDGTKTGKCKLCGITETVTDEGSALGHAYSDYVSNHNATCTDDGTKSKICANCGDRKTVTDEGSALGHAYSDYTSNNDATCTADGTKSATCANCGRVDTVTEENTALGHSFTNYIFDDNYTCTLDGTETAKCDRCDATDWRIVAGTAAHRYVDGFCLFCDKADPGPNCAGLTGNLTAFGKGTAQMVLTPVGETIPAATLTTTDGTYSFQVAPGEYILTVSQEGTATRTYTVTLTEGETTLDVKLHQPGDVTGDGRLNVGDVAKIYAHSKRTAELTDDYQLLCADYNGDGRINVGDAARVYALIKSK